MSEKVLGEGTVLEKIAAATRMRVERESAAAPATALKKYPGAPRDLVAALKHKGPRVIAEVKLRSPSDAHLGDGLDPIETALDYARNGAAALSVLTEPEFFGGSVEFLSAIRKKVDLPLLMKDFFLDPYQVLQARAAGADAILLIVALLGRDGVRDLLARARQSGLAALVEVHSEAELDIALGLGADLIGVNNRDLKTLKVDLNVSHRLAAAARGSGAVFVAESGLRARADVDELAALGYRGFLIGTSFIKTGKPGAALAALLGRRPA